MPAPTPNPRGDEFRNSTMGHAWVSQQAVISDVFTSITSVSLDAAAARLGEHVIDIGCGTGDTLLAFAKIVGPSGAVLGVDVLAPCLTSPNIVPLRRHLATQPLHWPTRRATPSNRAGRIWFIRNSA